MVAYVVVQKPIVNVVHVKNGVAHLAVVYQIQQVQVVVQIQEIVVLVKNGVVRLVVVFLQQLVLNQIVIMY